MFTDQLTVWSGDGGIKGDVGLFDDLIGWLGLLVIEMWNALIR